MSKKTAKGKRSKRDKKWDKRNGKELDRILPGPSRTASTMPAAKAVDTTRSTLGGLLIEETSLPETHYR